MRELPLNDMIERINVSQLKLSSASSSFGGGGSTEQGQVVRYARDSRSVYRIEETEDVRFDEEEFLRRLSNEIKLAAAKANVKISGSSQSADICSFDYTQGQHEGRLTLIGARTGGDEYKLWCLTSEVSLNSNDG